MLDSYYILPDGYVKDGYSFKCTCLACPEQYDVYKDGVQVAYLRLRHGKFRVDVPDCGEETIYTASPIGDGHFDECERMLYLEKALQAIKAYYGESLKPCPFCGGEVHFGNFNEQIFCSSCTCCMNKSTMSKEELIKAWNKRDVC